MLVNLTTLDCFTASGTKKSLTNTSHYETVRGIDSMQCIIFTLVQGFDLYPIRHVQLLIMPYHWGHNGAAVVYYGPKGSNNERLW